MEVITQAGATGAALGLQYSPDSGTTWKALDNDTTNAQSTVTCPVDSIALNMSSEGTIHANARTDVQIRVVGSGGDGALDPLFRNGLIELYFA